MKNFQCIPVSLLALMFCFSAPLFTGCTQKPATPPVTVSSSTAEQSVQTEPVVETEPTDEAPNSPTKEETAVNEKPAVEVVKAVAKPSSPIDKSSNPQIKPGDWAQWGGTSYRNNTPIGTNIPIDWDTGSFDRKTGEWDKASSVNIKWFSNLGSQTYGNAVVAGGKVYVGTNNGAGYLPRYPATVDLGCLVCFNEADGKFLWQHSSEKLSTGRVHDWPLQGICCAPLVEGNRLWFVTSRGEVRCLDTEGYYDNEDDGIEKASFAKVFSILKNTEKPEADVVGPALAALKEGKLSAGILEAFAKAKITIAADAAVKAEEGGKKWSFTAGGRQYQLTAGGPRLTATKLMSTDDKDEADVIWVFNMMKSLGASQHNMCSCSVTAIGDILFVSTSNGQDESHAFLPAPDATSFFAMDKNTGEVFWTDKSPGMNILHGQWSSPTVGMIQGKPQVIFGGGDGWVYSFRADQGKDGKPELLWKFDANPKDSEWVPEGSGTRNNIIATPVIHDGLVYVAVGQDPEHGEGDGHLWCIDPTKSGDISPQLAVNVSDRTKTIPPRRIQAVIAEDGEVAIDNQNSGAIWHYSSFDSNEDGSIDFEETMHRSCGTVAIKNNLLFISDFSGLFHCLDPKTGKVHWTYDMLAAAWGSPLIVEEHVYIGDEDGDVSIFNLTAEPHEPIAELNMGSSVYSTPIVANNVLYISTKNRLFAIEAAK